MAITSGLSSGGPGNLGVSVVVTLANDGQVAKRLNTLRNSVKAVSTAFKTNITLSKQLETSYSKLSVSALKASANISKLKTSLGVANRTGTVHADTTGKIVKANNASAAASNNASKASKTQITRVAEQERQLGAYYTMQAKGIQLNKTSINKMGVLEKQYTKQHGSVKNLRAHHVKLSEQWQTGNKTIDSMNKRLNNLRWTMVNVMFAVMALVAVYKLLQAPTKWGMEMETLFTRIQVVTGTTAETAKKAIIALRNDTMFSLEEMGGAYLEFTKQGFSAGEAMSALPAITSLATVGFTTLDEATKIVAQTLHEFSLEATDSAHVADVLAKAANLSAADVETFGIAMSYAGPIAAQAGMEFEETAAALSILSNMGLKASKAGTSYAAALTKIINPTDAVQEKARALGVSFFDAEGDMKSMTEIIAQLTAALSTLTDESKLEFLSEMFGRRGGRAIMGLMTAYEQGSGSIDAFTAALDDQGYASRKMAEINETSAAKMKRTWGDIKTSLVGVGDKFNNFFGNILENLHIVVESNEWEKLRQQLESLGVTVSKEVPSLGLEKEIRDIYAKQASSFINYRSGTTSSEEHTKNIDEYDDFLDEKTKLMIDDLNKEASAFKRFLNITKYIRMEQGREGALIKWARTQSDAAEKEFQRLYIALAHQIKPTQELLLNLESKDMIRVGMKIEGVEDFEAFKTSMLNIDDAMEGMTLDSKIKLLTDMMEENALVQGKLQSLGTPLERMKIYYEDIERIVEQINDREINVGGSLDNANKYIIDFKNGVFNVRNATEDTADGFQNLSDIVRLIGTDLDVWDTGLAGIISQTEELSKEYKELLDPKQLTDIIKISEKFKTISEDKGFGLLSDSTQSNFLEDYDKVLEYEEEITKLAKELNDLTVEYNGTSYSGKEFEMI